MPRTGCVWGTWLCCKSQTQTSKQHTNTQAFDTFLFLLVGVFILVALDIVFRAGKRIRPM